MGIPPPKQVLAHPCCGRMCSRPASADADQEVDPTCPPLNPAWIVPVPARPLLAQTDSAAATMSGQPTSALFPTMRMRAGTGAGYCIPCSLATHQVRCDRRGSAPSRTIIALCRWPCRHDDERLRHRGANCTDDADERVCRLLPPPARPHASTLIVPGVDWPVTRSVRVARRQTVLAQPAWGPGAGQPRELLCPAERLLDTRMERRGATMHHLIALVDDDELNLRLMDLWLRVAGYQTLRCAAQAATYDVVRAARPAAIILDLMEGPRPAGWAALAQLQGDPLTSAIPVIMCSAHTDLLRAQQAYLRRWGGETLGKPFTVAGAAGQVGG